MNASFIRIGQEQLQEPKNLDLAQKKKLLQHSFFCAVCACAPCTMAFVKVNLTH